MCLRQLRQRDDWAVNDIPRKDVEALDWMQVGRYALQFLWSDAHSTGIYPFTLLRHLCQCDQCLKLKAQSKT